MKVSELRQTVETLRELLEASNARVANLRGLEDFIGLLEARDDQTLDQFIAELEAAAKPTKPINNIVVRKHVNALNEAGLDREAFRPAFEALSQDKSVGAAEADMIFKHYHGGCVLI